MEHVFGARLADTGEGPFLRTGDLGLLRDGQLFPTGRLKNLIIVAGRNHSAEDIEQTVESAHPALRPSCSAAFSVDLDGEERLVIAAELDQRRSITPVLPPAAELAETIRRAVAERHDVRAHTVLLVRAAGLPRTTSGKVQRHLCREHFLTGTFKLLDES
jgi:acyl-CoA synthetase (AMP-forming)/AMP-acid ligase II